MLLQLAHTRLDVFVVSKQFALACYKATKVFPSEEKFSMIQQIRRAALSVHLNVAEGCLRKSLVAALDIAVELGYSAKERLTEVGELLVRSFQLISKMISR